jgi:hypothetical protein
VLDLKRRADHVLLPRSILEWLKLDTRPQKIPQLVGSKWQPCFRVLGGFNAQ